MTAQSEVSLEGVRVVEAGERGPADNKAGEGVAKAGEGEVARRRASLPLEARQSEFKEMLLERGVRVGGLRVRVGGGRDEVGPLRVSVVVLEVRVDLDARGRGRVMIIIS